MFYKKRNRGNDVRPFQLYVILVCGFIIIIAGLYLFLKNNYAHGISLPGPYGGEGGRKIILDGKSIIVIGIIFCIFPLYELINQSRRK